MSSRLRGDLLDQHGTIALVSERHCHHVDHFTVPELVASGTVYKRQFFWSGQFPAYLSSPGMVFDGVVHLGLHLGLGSYIDAALHSKAYARAIKAVTSARISTQSF